MSLGEHACENVCDVEVTESVNWLCGDFGVSAGECASVWPLAPLSPCGSEPEVSQEGVPDGIWIILTFLLLDASLPPAPVSPDSGAVSVEQAVSWTKACGSSVTSGLCPLPF